VGEFVEAGAARDLPEGKMRAVNIKGRAILLARVGNQYYAADDRCPHFGARLSEGRLEGVMLTCPRHGSQFDLRDGRVLKWTDFPGPVAAAGKIFKRPRPLTLYPVKRDGDRLLVQL